MPSCKTEGSAQPGIQCGGDEADPLVAVFDLETDGDGHQCRRKSGRGKSEAQSTDGYAAGSWNTIVFLSAAIEQEMLELDEAERDAFMADLGLSEPASHRLSRCLMAASV